MLTPQQLTQLKTATTTGGVPPTTAMTPEQAQAWASGGAPEPSLGTRIGNDITGAGENIKSAIKGTGAYEGQNPVERGVHATESAFGAPLKVASEVLPAPARKLIGDVGTGAGKAIELIAKITGNSTSAQKFVERFPEATNHLEAMFRTTQGLGNIANDILLYKGAADLGNAGVNAAKNTIGKIQNTLNPQPLANKIVDMHLSSAQQVLDTNSQSFKDLGGQNALIERLKTNIADGLKGEGQTGASDAVSKLNPTDYATIDQFSKAAHEAVSNVPPEVTPSESSATNAKAHDAIDTEVRSLGAKYSTIGKLLNESEVARGNDPVKVLSSYESGKALPKIAKGKLQPDQATNFLKGQIKILSGIKNRLAETGDSTSLAEFLQAAYDKIDSGGGSLAKKAADKADVEKIIKLYDETYPEGIPNTELDKIKTEQTKESSSYNSKSPFSLDAHGIVGDAARTLVEDKATPAPIEELNKFISSHYDAIKLLNTMRGKAPHGGALSRMMNNTIGEVGGLAAGMAVGHPFLGAMVGRAGAEAVTEVINNHFISNPLKRAIVNNMTDADPAVVKQALDYLKSQEASGAKPGDNVPTPVDEGNNANESDNTHASSVAPPAGTPAPKSTGRRP